MTIANDSILVTPGSGATVATHTVSAKEHQLMMLADAYGHVDGTAPRYRLFVPASAVGANQVFFDLFNASGSGKTLLLDSIRPVVDLDTAVTGAVSIRLFLTRTTAVGTGGTAATADGTSTTAATISQIDPADSAPPAQVTARLRPTGGATAGAVLSECHVAPEESNTGMGYLSQLAELVKVHGGVVVPANTGVRVVQGGVASVGTIGFLVDFRLV